MSDVTEDLPHTPPHNSEPAQTAGELSSVAVWDYARPGATGVIGLAIDWMLAMKKHAPYLMIIALGLLAMHLSAITTVYGYADDYPTLQGAVTQNPWIRNVYVSNGRPILGYLTIKSLQWAGTVDRLGLLRAITALAQCMLAFCIYRQLICFGRKAFHAALITLLILSIPSFVIMVAWGGTYVGAQLGFFLTYLSYLCLPQELDHRLALARLKKSPVPADVENGQNASILENEFSFSGRSAVSVMLSLLISWRFLLAIFFLVGAMLTYQPPSLFFWFWIALELLYKASTIRRMLTRFALALVVFFVSGGCYFVLWKLSIRLLNVAPVGDRTQMVGSQEQLHQKWLWFIREALPNTLYFGFIELWDLSKNWCWWIGAFVVLIGLCSLAIAIFRRRDRLFSTRVVSYLLILATIPLSFIVSLVVVESYATFRTRIAMAAVLMLLFSGAIVALSSFIFRGRWAWIGQALLAIFTLGMVAKGGYNIDYYVATPQNLEYSYVVSAARQFDFAKHDKLLIIHNNPRYFSIFCTNQYYGEFGLPTSCTDPAWGCIRSLFVSAFQARERQYGLPQAVPAEIIEEGSFYHDQSPPPRTLVLDMRRLVEYRRIEAYLPLDLEWQLLHPTAPTEPAPAGKASDAPLITHSEAPAPVASAPAALPSVSPATRFATERVETTQPVLPSPVQPEAATTQPTTPPR